MSGACAVYCPAGASTLEPAKKAFTACDLCGGDPLCAAVCPSEALRFEDDAEGSARRRTSYAARFFGAAPKEAERPALPGREQWERIAGVVSKRLRLSITASELEAESLSVRKAMEEEGM